MKCLMFRFLLYNTRNSRTIFRSTMWKEENLDDLHLISDIRLQNIQRENVRFRKLRHLIFFFNYNLQGSGEISMNAKEWTVNNLKVQIKITTFIPLTIDRKWRTVESLFTCFSSLWCLCPFCRSVCLTLPRSRIQNSVSPDQGYTQNSESLIWTRSSNWRNFE